MRKNWKRYLAFVGGAFLLLKINLSPQAFLGFFILGMAFYGFYLIAKQSRLDDKKLKHTKKEPVIQTLLQAKQPSDLMNWQFQSMPTMSNYTDKGEIGILLLLIVVFCLKFIVIETTTSLTIKIISVLVILVIGNFFLKFYKRYQRAKNQYSNSIAIFELTPKNFIQDNGITKNLIDWHDIIEIEYEERPKYAPLAIKIVVNNQMPILLEQKFLNCDISILIEMLKNYWFLCTKGKPFPRIT